MKGISNNGEHSIGRWISILHRYGQCYVSKKLEHHNIGSGQYGILLSLSGKGGISQEELSDYLKIDKGSIAKSIKKLEDEAYVNRSIVADDKRTYKVSLTQKGLNIIPIVQEAINCWEVMITSGLSESDKQIVDELLYKMAKKAYGFKTNDEEIAK
jgi:DNA-binding MarR family transcriptional regulator